MFKQKYPYRFGRGVFWPKIDPQKLKLSESLWTSIRLEILF